MILNAGGNVNVTGAVQAIDAVDIDGAAVSLGSLDSGNGNILATGTVDIGPVSGGSHTIQGTIVSLGAVNMNGTLTGTATTGSFTAAGIDANTAVLGAATDLDVGNAVITGAFTADAGNNISFGDVTGRDIQFTAGGSTARTPCSTGNSPQGSPTG